MDETIPPGSGPGHNAPTAPSLSGQNPPSAEPAPGETIGPYRVLDVLGRGGFGVVYLAEQREPVRRRVAVKVLRAGMASDEIVARFEAERQALALMDHPGVAKVFDAGIAPGGSPYFAMEYVQGVPITEYCDSAGLGVRARLELFVGVCRAVQHAHQKGIIHRDIKPSNVLVALVDGKPVPKVIDFGIAKAVASPLTDRTLHTQMGRMLGTPEYMSPEQAGTSGLDVDTRTDVYSLGVMFFQLLTGLLPFDGRTLRQAGYDGIRRLIQETDPPKPSTRLESAIRAGSGERPGPGGACDEAPTPLEIARSRGTDPVSLRRALAGDLDWIAMKALEKDRTRRYESPSALAGDIERHLRHEAVIAGPPSASYRARKFVRRHRLGVSVAVLFAAVLSGAVVALALMYGRVESQRAAAEQAGARANAAFAFVGDMFSAIDPAAAQGREITVREVLAGAQKRAREKPFDDPVVEASVRSMLGRAYHSIGRSEEAEPNLRRVAQIRRAALGERHPDTLQTEHDLAAALLQLGHLDEGSALLGRVIEGRTAVLGGSAPETLASRSLAIAALQFRDEYAAAEKPCRELLAEQERVIGRDARDTLDTRLSLADILDHLGRYEEAAAVAGEAAALGERAFGLDDPITMTALSIQSSALQEMQKPETLAQAEAIDLRLLESRRRVLGPSHRETLLTIDQLGDTYKYLKQMDKAVEMKRQAFEGAVASPALGPDHPATLSYMHNYGMTLQLAGQFDESERLLRECLDKRRRIDGPDAIPTYVTLNQLGLVLMDTGRHAEALPILEQVRDGLKGKVPDSHWMHGVSRTCIGECLLELRRYSEAERTLREAHALLVASMGEDHPRTRRAASALAKVCEGIGRTDEAAAWREKAGEAAP